MERHWTVSSNKEAGEGYADILVEMDDDDEPVGMIIACQAALEQIQNRRYHDAFYHESVKKVLKYAIACYKDQCRVLLAADL